MKSSFEVQSNNIKDTISIYYDSNKIREQKEIELEGSLELGIKHENWFNEYTHYQHHFDWLLMHSLFISSFTYFESFMRNSAKKVELKTDNYIKISDIKGNSDIDKYRKYINLIGKIESAKNEGVLWTKIMEFKHVRNIITHHYGRLKIRLNIVEKHDIFFGPSKSQIRIKNIAFLEDFAETSIKYMKNITEEFESNKG